MILVAALMLFVATPQGDGQVCQDGSPIGRITAMDLVENQPVQIRRVGTVSWTAAQKNDPICVGDQIRTRFRSRARLVLATLASEMPIQVIVGINSRVRVLGDWHGEAVAGESAPLVEVVHGVVRLVADEPPKGAHRIRTGLTTCDFYGAEVYSNWDPFKREANHVVVRGKVTCSFDGSTTMVGDGQSLEIVRGEPGAVRPRDQLLLDVFSRATRMK